MLWQTAGIDAAGIIVLSSKPTLQPTREPTREPTKMPALQLQPAAAAAAIPIIFIAIGMGLVAFSAGLVAYFRYYRKTPSEDGDGKVMSHLFHFGLCLFTPLREHQTTNMAMNPVQFEIGEVYAEYPESNVEMKVVNPRRATILATDF